MTARFNKRRAAVMAAATGGILLLAVSFTVALQGGSRPPVPAGATVAGAGVGCMGRVEPASRMRRLAPPESGRVATLAELTAGEGDQVAAGQLLGWFSDRAARAAALQQAEAEAQGAAARLEQVRAGAKSGDVSAAEARVGRQRAAEINARAERERVEKLAAQKFVAPTELDARRAAWDVAVAELRAAEQEFASVAEVRNVDVAVAETEVAQGRAAVERARAELALAELRAPIAGTVLKIHAWPGEQVGALGVLDLADLNDMHVVAEVYETDVARVRIGQTAEVIVPGSSERLRGAVVDLGWQVRKRDVMNTDPVDEIDARIVEVRVRLEADGARLLARLSHMRVQVVIGG